MRSLTSYLLLIFMVMFWIFRIIVAFTTAMGIDLYNIVMGIINGAGALTDYTRAFVSFIGMVIPVAVFFNILVDKNRMAHPVDKKTDWFYKNEEFDRKIDSRADTNQYRNY